MMDTTATPIIGSKDTTHLIFLQHDFRGFDYGSDRVADLQIHLFGASSGYDAFDEVLANLNDDVGHDPTQLNFRDFALESIPCRKFHSQIINAGLGLVQEKRTQAGRASVHLLSGPSPRVRLPRIPGVQIQAFAAEAA
jgi:hypothetical protein